MNEPRPPTVPDVDPQDLLPGDPDLLPGDYREGVLFEAVTLAPGECEFFESVWRRVTLGDTLTDRLALTDCLVDGLDEPVLRMPAARWRGVHLRDSRLGSVEWHSADWQRVLVSGCRLGYVNLRGAHVEDVLFRDCTIDELDLVDLSASRVAFQDCRVDSLVVRGGRLTDVDLRGAVLTTIDGIEHLRGATITADQLLSVAPAMAAHLGIGVVEESAG